MKVCYCDESGTGDEPIAVMVGVIVDAQRMHVTKDDWHTLLGSLSRITGKTLQEIHTRDFYSGRGSWRGMPGPQRSEVIDSIFSWLVDRKHDVVYTSLIKDEFYKSFAAGHIHAELSTPWRFIGCHLLLAVQRHFQKLEKTKGHTIFIFDSEERERMRFTDIVASTPAWMDSYYSKSKKQTRLEHIVDVPYFGDSKEVALIQVADFVAYFLRRYAEIKDGYSTPNYPDEMQKVGQWIAKLSQCAIPAASIYPATGRCECAEMFFRHASPAIRQLQR